MDASHHATAKQPLLGMTLDELKQLARELGMPSFAAKQIAEWVYGRRARTIDEMTNLSKANREKLKADYEVGLRPHADAQHSVDGTVKYLFPVGDKGKMVETVFIPDGDRATLCVSCQVECNLSAADILNQICALPESDRLTNIVFMGQGEPMDNLEQVLKATQVLTAPWGMAWSPRRITVSTVGLRGKLKRFIEESECHLAISLHSPLPDQRRELMPAERAMSITEIVDLLRNYDFAHRRRLSFEYIVFAGVNDSEHHARQLVRLLGGLDCRVNLIRFHQIPGVDLHGADDATMLRMRDYLTQHGLFTTIRASRGQDIYAACGLLSTARKAKE